MSETEFREISISRVDGIATVTISKAGLAQCEALMGITPGGGGTQSLSQNITRGRALKAVLGAGLFHAQAAERYGWINRALAADQLDSSFDNLARIAAPADSGTRAELGNPGAT